MSLPTTDLDDVTTYYLLHRNDFGFTEAPSGMYSIMLDP